MKLFFREMLRIRMIEEKISEIYHVNNEMKCPTHLCNGQEATPVGVCQALQKEDVITLTHRTHGWYLAKGGNLKSMMAELFGKETGCCKGWGGSMHLFDRDQGVMSASPILAGSIPHAVGAALTFQIKCEEKVAVAVMGDAAIEEGVFHECLNWASLKKLPVIFVCENNLYSTISPLKDRQPPVPIYARAASYGIPGNRVDGCDVSQIHEVASNAVQRARKGDGPTLIESMTYRYLEHVGPNEDIHMGYRTREELDSWKEKDPLKLCRKYLEKSEINKIKREIDEEISLAIQYARQSKFPSPEVLVT